MDHDSARAVHGAARRAARSSDAPLLLAVSGGLDSMALLVAMARTGRARVAAVSSFDHGTGAAATAACAHVARVAGNLGLPVVLGHAGEIAPAPDGREAAWRVARHEFLASAARSLGARVATAHTRDDQVETVLMRLLRGSGARGLAGLEAPSPILRPFLGIGRATLRAYLVEAGVEWVEDPSNESPAHLRNRIRHDLLPALRAVDPGVDDGLLQTGRAAARWRAEVDAFVAQLGPVSVGGSLSVASAELAGYDRDSLCVLWGALAARIGLSLDRRGTHRLAAFTMKEPASGTVPLSGGWCLEARQGLFTLRRAEGAVAAPATLPAEGMVEWGRFRFRVGGEVATDPGRACWSASLPGDAPVRVRGWAAGDRLLPAAGQSRRRVARYLSDAGLAGMERAGWPVVVVGEERHEDVVWIPGVRRSDAATERSGRPVRHYVCERIAP